MKTTDAFRKGDSYRFIEDGKLLYSDHHHLSVAGALFLAPVAKDMLMDIAARKEAR